MKRVSIKREGKIIEINTYILTFNTPIIPKEIKIGYNIERVEQFIPNPLRCYNCQKFGHHEDGCRGRTACDKCGRRDPGHLTNECKETTNCANCGGDHLSYSRECDAFKKEKNYDCKTHQKHLLPEARRIVEGYMKGKTYSQVARETTTKQDK